MDNVISLNSKRKGKAGYTIRAIEWILSQNQTLIIGTSDVEGRMKQLEAWFPDAKLEVVELGIKICNRK